MSRRLLVRRLATTTPSFVQRAREAKQSSVLLGPFLSSGTFDRCLEAARMDITSIGPEGVQCELNVTNDIANNFGTLHGGATATLVDVVGTLALLGRDPTRPGVSTEMNQSFTAAAKVGSRIACVGTVLKYGKSLGFTQVEIRCAADPSRVFAVGRHTKYLAV